MALLCMLILMIIAPALFLKACNSHSLPISNVSTFCEGKPNGVYANPQSCSSFWACWDNGLKGSLLLCPPNTLWHQPSLSCTHSTTFNSTDTTRSSPNSSASNNSIAGPSSLMICGRQQAGGRHAPALHYPIWSWDGLLRCYGYGCRDHVTQTHKIQSRMDIGIPCAAAQELISIGKRSAYAWMPAPHAFADQLRDIVGNRIGGQHWKIRLEKGDESAMLKAFITDYSPSQRIKDSWQGGAMQGGAFSLKGPRESPSGGGCYYSIALESPHFHGMWEAFARDLVKQSRSDMQAITVQVGDLFHLRRKKRVHTMQECLQSFPWASLVATALCYASNARGGLQSMSLCSTDLPSSDLFTIAKCFGSLLGISSDLGL